jgi:hypothetical protein
MPRRTLTGIGGSLVLLVALLATVAVASPRTLTTQLSGAEEVPMNDSAGRGVAVVQLSQDGSALTYRLNVANIENVTQAHIHLGAAGSNGPVVAWLYPSGPPAQLIPGRSSGTLATGTITAEDLVGPLAGQPLSALWSSIAAGTAYVNVHTSQHPPGEIRGQMGLPGRHGH